VDVCVISGKVDMVLSPVRSNNALSMSLF
jgi:hypothetical protein